ncbi:CobQ/CobB/MinD/ParA nucleotide binding domain protein [compost metagenome]
MARKVYAFFNQKGGAGKTSSACSLALSYALEGKRVLLADMDRSQQMNVEDWYNIRAAALENLTVKNFRSIADVAILAKDFDFIVFDGGPNSNELTMEIAEVADRIIIPTGTSRFDLRPSARLALGLIDSGIDAKKIRMALYKTLSEAEEQGAAEALEAKGLKVCASLKCSVGYALALDVGKGLQEASHPSLREAGSLYVQGLRA